MGLSSRTKPCESSTILIKTLTTKTSLELLAEFCFSPFAVCAPNVGFLTMELGMTRRGRGPSVLPVGVRLLIGVECRKCEMHVVKQNKQVGTTGGN